jgi:membrane protein
MGAAIAYYTVFSLAPMLVMVLAIAGLAFGQKAAEGALLGELADLIGPVSAAAVQAMLRSASGTWSGILATAVGIGTLIIAATAVFGELRSALNVIWKGSGGREPRRLASPKVTTPQPLGHPRNRFFATGVARDQHRVGGLQRLS